MNADELLHKLQVMGVALEAEGDRLRVSAARGQLDGALRAAIAEHKPALLAALRARATPRPLARASRGGPLALSFFQERLWLLARLDPEDTSYALATTWTTEHAVAPGAARAAVLEAIGRHEVLRTAYREQGGQPRAFVLGLESVPVEERDLSALPPGDALRAVDAAARASVEEPFDLAAAPPVRFTVFTLAGGRAGIQLVAHHVAYDATSLGLLGRELLAACRGEALPPAPAIGYADFAAWERAAPEAEVADALAWWGGRLAGAPPASMLPRDHRPAHRPRSASCPFALDLGRSDALRAALRSAGATPYMAAVTACAAVLRWSTGQDDLVLGCPMAPRERPELEGVLGPFVNLLPLRLDLSGDPTLAEALGRTRTAVLDAHAHRQVPFERLVEALRPVRSLEHTPVFQVAVVQHGPDGEARAVVSGGAVFDLTLYLTEREGAFTGGVEYRADLYDEETARAFTRRVTAALEACADDLALPISALPLLHDAERRQVLETFNATATEVDEAPFHLQLDRQAAATPEAIAVGFEGEQLSYAELVRHADRVARLLREEGVARGDVVAICMPRSAELVAALAGIQKAGAGYLPLDPDFPAERLAFMLADGSARVLLARGPLPRDLAVPPSVRLVDLAVEGARLAAMPAGPPDGGAEPGDLAYLLYTSGSTGAPKGVRVPHAALSNFLASMRRTPGLSAGDVLAAVTTLSFDIAGLELYLPLTVGARVQVVSKAVASDGGALARELADRGATVLQATPATWRLLLQAGWRGGPAFRALCGGEPLPRDLADALLERVGELWNLYGPTETTIWSTAGRVEPGTGPVRIGRPIANTSVYVLDPGGRPLPPGVAGELWIGGAGVADGYHGRPELTAERFRPDPFHAGRMYRTGDLGRWDRDGSLEHLGRLDHQVKVRGFRIELGEIEAVLSAHPAVQQAVVAAREAAPGDARLVAYVVWRAGEDLTASEVRRHLRRKLPEYMVPALVVTLQSVPLTPNGKVDRARLPDPFAGAAGSRSPAAPLASGAEQELAAIWREILRVERIGPEDNFFELGGHSLLALRVTTEVQARLGRRLDPRVLFFQNLRQVARSLHPA